MKLLKCVFVSGCTCFIPAVCPLVVYFSVNFCSCEMRSKVTFIPFIEQVCVLLMVTQSYLVTCFMLYFLFTHC